MANTLSIVICTLNREEVFCSTLSGLLRFEAVAPLLEVIVVDQTRKHADATEKFLSDHASQIQLHRVEFASLTRARNYGIRHAKGDVILFLDDDVEPSPTLIEGHLRCYSDPGIWGVAGGVLLPGRGMLSKKDLSPAEVAKIERRESSRFDVDWPHETRWAPGCNMSFRRESLYKVGGFDEAFYGSALGEEAELCHRLTRAGGRIQYSPDAKLVHLVNPSGGCRDETEQIGRLSQAMDNIWYFSKQTGVFFLPRIFRLWPVLRPFFANAARQGVGGWVRGISVGMKAVLKFALNPPLRAKPGLSGI